MAESQQLTAQQACAALDEADLRAAQVRRRDRQLALILMILAGVDLGAGALVSLSPHQGRSFAGSAVLLVLAAGIAATVGILVRIGISVIVAIIPLLMGAFLIWRRA